MLAPLGSAPRLLPGRRAAGGASPRDDVARGGRARVGRHRRAPRCGRDGRAGRGRAAPAVGAAAGSAARGGGAGRRGRGAVLLGVGVLLPQPGLLLRGQPLRVEERAAQGPPRRHQAALHQRPGGVGPVAALRAAVAGAHGHPARRTPAHADGRPAGGHLPGRAAAAAAHHDPLPRPADAAVHGPAPRPGRRAEGGAGAPVLGPLPHGHAVAAEPGDRAPDGGAGVPGLHAAHAGAVHGPGPRRVHLPALLRSRALPPHLRAAALPPEQRGEHLPVRSVPVLLHSRLRCLHGFPLHPHRPPDRAGALPLVLQLHGLPGRVRRAGAPAEAAAAGGLRPGRGALPAPAPAPHGPQALRQPPPLRASGAGRGLSGPPVLLTQAPACADGLVPRPTCGGDPWGGAGRSRDLRNFCGG